MLRYAGSLALGLLMVLTVLIAMQSLVVGRQFQLNAGSNTDASSVVNLNNVAPVALQIGALPPKPGANREPGLPEDSAVARVAPPDLPLPALALPAYKPQFAAGATQSVVESEPETAAPASTTAPAAQPVLAVGDIVLVDRVDPKFPPQAIREDISSGSVTVKFTVQTDGSVTNPTVTDAKPRRGIFDDAALRAVARWKFKPIAAPRDTSVVVDFNQGGGG
ncbi:MAG TPA: energy transducer TonB [Gammaproteobacteria bacterium]|jgi:protein TonB